MTAVPKDPQISELRELFRYLQEFRSVYEATGLEEIRTPYGNTWSLFDLEYLYRQSRIILTSRQCQAISLCLVHNMREKDAARAMGVSPSNPVMMYATLGIRRLLDAVDGGLLERFRAEDEQRAWLSLQHRRQQALNDLAIRIRKSIKLTATECWAYPVNGSSAPSIRLRSSKAVSGFIIVHPMVVLYEHSIMPIPPLYDLLHRVGKQHHACVNPEHGMLQRQRDRGVLYGALRRTSSPGAGGQRPDLRIIAGGQQPEREIGHPYALEGAG